MRVLLVAPGMADLNTTPEIRAITEMHSVHVLNGNVTWADLMQACRAGQRDILHFATHSNSQRLRLSDVELTPEHVAQACRLTGAKVVFFNSCESSRHAAFAVRNGVEFAIHTTMALPDAQAWQTPLAFYQYLRQQKLAGAVDVPAAFLLADAGDGMYGFYQSINTSRDGIHEIVDELRQLRDNVASRRHIRLLWYSHVVQWAVFGSYVFWQWMTAGR